jgi:hypothetical protein
MSTLMIASALVACAGDDSAVSSGDIELAQTALAPFKQQLKAALLNGLESGPEDAITVCSRTAPEIAAHLSRNGVEMGRTSHKLRNPKNAPPDWAKELLADYAKGSRDPFRAVVIGNGRFGYVEPVYTQKLCLMCHGASVAPALAARIAQYYPEDDATGFEEGSFRGLFWVTMPLGSEEE